MRLQSLAWVGDGDYLLAIECEPEVTESFQITISSAFIDGKEIVSTLGCVKFITRVPDVMTRRDIYSLVSQFHLMRVASP